MYELIYRTGRLFGRLFHPLTCYRAWRGGSIAGRIYRTLRFAWRLLVLRPATLAGLVLVVTFLYQKMHGTAVPYWQDVLQKQAASYRDAPAGSVMQMSSCFTDNTASHIEAISPLQTPEDSNIPRFCEPLRVAQSDIAFLTGLYVTLVVLSFIWMGLSGQMLPVATEKGKKGGRAGSANMRSSRSQIIRAGDSVVVVTPEGEYHTLFVDKAGHLVATEDYTAGTEGD